MKALVVGTADLRGLSATVQRLATRLDLATAAAVLGTAAWCAAQAGAVCAPVGAAAAAVRQRELAVERLRALALALDLVSAGFEDVERRVASSFWSSGWPSGASRAQVAAQDDGALAGLLEHVDPTALEALLVSCPALARVVVDTTAPVGSDAARLAGLVGRLAPSPGTAAADARAQLAAAQGRVAGFLDDLGRARLLRLALLHPVLMTSAAAAPVAARIAASRVLVAADLARLWRSLAVARGDGAARLRRQVAQRQEWLTGEVVLRRPDGTVSRQPHQLLAFDPTGDGQVVELVGDVRTARHLAVFVPGTGSGLDRYPGSLRRVTRFASADASLAVVLWEGADFPDQPFDDGTSPLREHVLAAAYRDAADVAGPRLATEVAGLRQALPGPASDLTVVGHSYGGSIVGAAQVHGLPADRVVHVASAGTYTRRPVAAPGVEQFSMTAYDDPIRFAQGHDLHDAEREWRAMTPGPLHPAAPLVHEALVVVAGDPGQVGHGADPDLAPGVVRLDTGRYDSGRLVHGHSDMFTPGSTAFRNLVAVMTGQPVHVLEPARWSSHLEPAHAWVDRAGPHLRLPRYVVDRSPWTDPGYASPTVPTR